MPIQVKMPEDAKFLAPSIVDQLRLGSKNDGGYISPNNAWTSNCSVISMGVKDDWSFESNLTKLVPSANVLCFDPTVSAFGFLVHLIKSLFNLISTNGWSFRRRVGLVRLRLKTLLGYLMFFTHPKRRHIKKWCRLSGGKESISLTEAVSIVPQTTELLIKMDIEGDEYALLEDFLLSKDLPRTRAFFIEFHEISENWQVFSFVVKKLQQHFTITHFHANNCVRELGGNGLPRFIELTLLRNDLVASSGIRTILPVAAVDSPNKEEESDFAIAFS